jgi:hypothetical protein
VGHTSPCHARCMTMPIGSSGIYDLPCAKHDANDDAPMEHICVHLESPAHCNCDIICPAGCASAARIRLKGALSHADRVAVLFFDDHAYVRCDQAPRAVHHVRS